MSAAPSLVLNEIVYDDAATGLADQIEIYNAGTETVDLAGWKVADEKRDSFGEAPAGTSLAPGEFLVLVKDVDFPFGLGKGDEVVLFDPSGAEADSYAYENTAPLSVWARCADGTGEWAHATTATPGAANDCTVAPVVGSIVINEVDSQPADWVEFYNPGTEALDISGYEIRDNSDDHRWQFLAGTQIGAGEFLVVDEGTIGLVGGAEAAFRDPIGIGSADRIRLFDAAAAQIDDTLPWEGTRRSTETSPPPRSHAARRRRRVRSRSLDPRSRQLVRHARRRDQRDRVQRRHHRLGRGHEHRQHGRRPVRLDRHGQRPDRSRG